MATPSNPSHPPVVESDTHPSQQHRHGSVLVLLTTMATTLLVALAVIALTAHETAGVPDIASAVLAVA